jgi:hypothetical protein
MVTRKLYETGRDKQCVNAGKKRGAGYPAPLGLMAGI